MAPLSSDFAMTDRFMARLEVSGFFLGGGAMLLERQQVAGGLGRRSSASVGARFTVFRGQLGCPYGPGMQPGARSQL
jgi:hypothetical protein